MPFFTFITVRLAGSRVVQGNATQRQSATALIIAGIFRNSILCFFLNSKNPARKIIEVTASPKMKYSLCTGSVQKVNFSNAFAVFVTKSENNIDILKMKIEISWGIFWGKNEIAVATTPVIKLQKAGLTHIRFVNGDTVLNTPKKYADTGSVKSPANTVENNVLKKYSVNFCRPRFFILLSLGRIVLNSEREVSTPNVAKTDRRKLTEVIM